MRTTIYYDESEKEKNDKKAGQILIAFFVALSLIIISNFNDDKNED